MMSCNSSCEILSLVSHVHHKVPPENFGHDCAWLQAVQCLIFSSAASNASACSFFRFPQLTETTILSQNLVKIVLFHVQIFWVTAYFPRFLPIFSGSMTAWRVGHLTFPTLSLFLTAQAGIRLELKATDLSKHTTVLRMKPHLQTNQSVMTALNDFSCQCCDLELGLPSVSCSQNCCSWQI